MDGVIADTNPFHAIAWKQFLEKYQIFPSETDFQDFMYGKSNEFILKHFINPAFTEAAIEQLAFDKESLFRDIYLPHVQPVAGLVAWLEILNANHIITGVATSAPIENMDFILDKLNLRQHMQSLLSGNDVRKHKPDPEIYLKSAENLQVLPENCVVFEDSVSGVSAARNAGMKVVGVLTTYTPEQLPPCHAYISDYQGLTIDFLEKL
ncbi:MAG: HAD family phosphatase [Verrucomicrobia bacterium]|nr:HAD family phosphatase [Cytophagales bacterium]